MKQLKELCRDKWVLLVGSVPPPHIEWDKWDIVVRLNEWWAMDEGRCDVWFTVSGQDKIRTAWFFEQDHFKNQVRLICALKRGGTFEQIKQIAKYVKIPVQEYDENTEELRELHKWFRLRGGSPSTGLKAAVTLARCSPRRLLITGMDLYASEPEHKGWLKHNPLGHVYWYTKLKEENENIRLGSDLKKGIEWWDNEGRNS